MDFSKFSAEQWSRNTTVYHKGHALKNLRKSRHQNSQTIISLLNHFSFKRIDLKGRIFIKWEIYRGIQFIDIIGENWWGGIEVFHHACFRQHFRTKGGFSHPKDVFWKVEFKLKVLWNRMIWFNKTITKERQNIAQISLGVLCYMFLPIHPSHLFQGNMQH